jgi:organic hydroperoxide reductase OsmC/OhrA
MWFMRKFQTRRFASIPHLPTQPKPYNDGFNCHCGAIAFTLATSREPRDWPVRACQCEFCRSHGARTTSDPGGCVSFRVPDLDQLLRYRFGSRTADFLVCRECGAYVAAVLTTRGGQFATLNVNVVLDAGQRWRLTSATPGPPGNMHISAIVRTSPTSHEATVATAGVARNICIPPRQNGAGSSVNGGELLMLALATCYGNDLYREAVRLGVTLNGVEVVAEADFEGIGVAATNIRYRAKVDSPATPQEIERLLRETDAVAEIHNTVRSGATVELRRWE